MAGYTSDISNTLQVALEIGHSYSGYAYSTHADFVKDPLKILTCHWKPVETSKSCLKTPSVILFDKYEHFNSFGFEAEERFKELPPEEKRHWHLIKKFNSDQQVLISVKTYI